MPFVILSAILQIACIVHAVRTGRVQYWPILILIGSLLGCLAYFLVEILPELRNSRTAKRVVANVARTIDPEKRKAVWEFIRMTTTPEWQAKFTLLTSSPAPRRDALPAADVAARPDLVLINKAAADAVNLFPESVAVRENYNEFAKVFVESGMKLMTTDRPTADIMRDLQADLSKRIPLK